MPENRSIKFSFVVDEPSVRKASNYIRELTSTITKLVEVTQRAAQVLGNLGGGHAFGGVQMGAQVGGLGGTASPRPPLPGMMPQVGQAVNPLVKAVQGLSMGVNRVAAGGGVQPSTTYMSSQAHANLLATTLKAAAAPQIKLTGDDTGRLIVQKLDEIAGLLRGRPGIAAGGVGGGGAGGGGGFGGGGGGGGMGGGPAAGPPPEEPQKPGLMTRLMRGFAGRMVGQALSETGFGGAGELISAISTGYGAAGPLGAVAAGGLNFAKQALDITEQQRIANLQYSRQQIMDPLEISARVGGSWGQTAQQLRRGNLAVGWAYQGLRREGVLDQIKKQETNRLMLADIQSGAESQRLGMIGKRVMEEAGATAPLRTESLGAKLTSAAFWFNPVGYAKERLAAATDPAMIASYQIQQRRARDQIRAQTAEDMAKAVQDRIASDPRTARLWSEIGEGAMGEIGLMRGARLSGRIDPRTGMSALDRFQIRNKSRGWSDAEIAGMRAQIAQTAGAKYMGFAERIAGLQAGGLYGAGELLALGTQFGGGANAFLGAVQGGIGAGGIDVTAGARLGTGLSQALQAGYSTGAQFMPGAIGQALAGIRVGDAGQEMRLANQLMRGQQLQAGIMTGQRSPWFEYLTGGAAVQALGGGAERTFSRDWLLKLQRNPMAAQGLLAAAQQEEASGQAGPATQMLREHGLTTKEFAEFQNKAERVAGAHLTPEYLRRAMGGTPELEAKRERFIKFQELGAEKYLAGDAGFAAGAADIEKAARLKGRASKELMARGQRAQAHALTKVAADLGETLETLTSGMDPEAARGMYQSMFSRLARAGGGKGTGDPAGGRQMGFQKAMSEELSEDLRSKNVLAKSAKELYEITKEQQKSAKEEEQYAGAAAGTSGAAREAATALSKFAQQLDKLLAGGAIGGAIGKVTQIAAPTGGGKAGGKR